jgi:probable F420-dependent oxidoreductase
MSISVGLGIAEFPFSDVKTFWRWAAMCDEGGVNSIWQTDRMVSREPYLECMTSLAALVGATKRVKFGMNVASAGIRDPLILAKQCATIDLLSEGRLLPAFGIGNITAPVWTATGRKTKGRGARTDEALDIIKQLWSGEPLTVMGEFFHYENATISPRPVQKNFPFWIGGSSPAAIRRTARIGTGWLAGLETPEKVATVISAIRTAAEEAGRPIDDDHYGAGFPFRFGSWDDDVTQKAVDAYAKRKKGDPKVYMGIGGADEIIERACAYIDAGVSKFVLRPLANDDADFLDQTQKLIDTVIPVVEAMETVVPEAA